MKALLPLGLFLLLVCARSVSAKVTDEKTFLNDIQAAINGKSPQKLDALTYQVGMSEDDKKQVDDVTSTYTLTNKAVKEISLQPLPKDFESTMYSNGKKIETTTPPMGIIQVTFEPKNGATGMNSLQIPYAVVDGGYYVVTAKTTDLSWKGPPDVTIGYSVSGQGLEGVLIQGRYNVSGVEVSKTFNSPNEGFWGQYFTELTVTSNNAEADLTVTITRQGHDIYSQPLKGKGVLHYQRSL